MSNVLRRSMIWCAATNPRSLTRPTHVQNVFLRDDGPAALGRAVRARRAGAGACLVPGEVDLAHHEEEGRRQLRAERRLTIRRALAAARPAARTNTPLAPTA